MTTQVVTWSTGGEKIDVTESQEAAMKKAGVWPKNDLGSEYCQVSRGKHHGSPTYTDAEIAAFCAGQDLPSPYAHD